MLIGTIIGDVWDDAQEKVFQFREKNSLCSVDYDATSLGRAETG